jgi:hypothetical protein
MAKKQSPTEILSTLSPGRRRHIIALTRLSLTKALNYVFNEKLTTLPNL